MNRGIVITEQEILSVMDGMCAESLDPETFDMWEKVKEVLVDTRHMLAAAPKEATK